MAKQRQAVGGLPTRGMVLRNILVKFGDNVRSQPAARTCMGVVLASKTLTLSAGIIAAKSSE